MSLGLSCSDTESVAQTAPVDVPEGLSFSSERPDADQPLTITFKAAKSSDLYGYKGDVYLHIGIVNEEHGCSYLPNGMKILINAK